LDAGTAKKGLLSGLLGGSTGKKDETAAHKPAAKDKS